MPRDLRTLDIAEFKALVEQELSGLIDRVRQRSPDQWAENMTMVVAGELAGILQQATDERANIVATVNQVFERMAVPYRLRALE